jgi:hypothetical protein
MGAYFKAPPQQDVKQWQIIAVLYAVGFRFSSSWCYLTGFPRRLNEVEQFLVKEGWPREGVLAEIALVKQQRGRQTSDKLPTGQGSAVKKRGRRSRESLRKERKRGYSRY